MDKTDIGLLLLGSISALMVSIAYVLYKGKKYADEDAAQKKSDFKKNFLKIKSSNKQQGGKDANK